MKPLFFLAAILFVSTAVYTQPQVTWGPEFKLKKGSTDLSIIKAEAAGIYLEESHIVSTPGWWAPRQKKSSILVKLSADMNELYKRNYDKELRGKDFETFLFTKDKLYLFASAHEKSTRSFDLYAVEIDKNSGDIKSNWQRICNWNMGEKGSEVDFRITPNADTSKIILVSTNTGKAQNQYGIQVMDTDLRIFGRPFTISNEFDPKTFQLEDFIYTFSGNSVLVGRVYEYEEGKKKKDKNLLFKNYSIRIYDDQGKLKKELATDIEEKFFVSGRMIQLKNEIALAAFYSNGKRKKEINGMLVQRIDPVTGKVITETRKELNTSMISDDNASQDNKYRRKRNDVRTEEGLSSNLIFRNFYSTPDNGIVILAEKYDMTEGQYSSNFGGSTSFYTVETHTCGDIYTTKISSQGNIDWLKVLPKKQIEEIRTGGGSSSGPIVVITYFGTLSNRPFFAGFGCLQDGHFLNIFFNDSKYNANVLAPGTDVRRVTDFDATECFQVKLDLLTGKLTRKSLFSNRHIPPAMPRLSVVLNETLYLTGKDDARFGTRAKLAVGKITGTF